MSDTNSERWSKEALCLIAEQRGQTPPGIDEEVYLLGVLAGYLAACEKYAPRWVRGEEIAVFERLGWRFYRGCDVQAANEALFSCMVPPAPPPPEVKSE